MDAMAELVRLWRSEQAAGRSPRETAATVLEQAWPGLSESTGDRLVVAATMALGSADFPDEWLTPGLGGAIRCATLPWVLATWRSWSAADQRELMMQGLLELARQTALAEQAALDVAIERSHAEEIAQSLPWASPSTAILVLVAWIPSLLSAAVASVAVAWVNGNIWLFPALALLGTVLGTLATWLAWSVIRRAGRRWRLPGRHAQAAFDATVIFTGPLVVLLVVVVAMHLPLGPSAIEIDLAQLGDVAGKLGRVVPLVWLACWLIGRMRQRS